MPWLGTLIKRWKKCSMGGLASWVADGKPKSYGFFEYLFSSWDAIFTFSRNMLDDIF